MNIDENALFLTCRIFHDKYVVEDSRGGIWWPSEAQQEIIDRANNPEETAISLALNQPAEGEWVD